MQILLQGSSWFSVETVKLYQEAHVNAIMGHRAKALKAFGPSGASLGVAGAPSWTLAAEASALSIVGGIIAGAVQKQGAHALKQSQQAMEELLSGTGEFKGEYFACSEIKNISLPHPQAWSASKGSTNYIHSGDEFVWVTVSGRPMAVQWRSVLAVAAN